MNEVVRERVSYTATLTLTFELRQRSRLRGTLDDGRTAMLMLTRGIVLRDGDRVRAGDGTIICIVAAPEPVSTVYCPDPHLLARASYHLGNRHIALQIGAGWLRYQQDHVLDKLVHELGLHPVPELLPFEPETGAYGQAHANTSGPESIFVTHAGDCAPAERNIASDPDLSFRPSLLSLLWLTSSSLPIGSFAYSQGMEYAVEKGWISNAAGAGAWVAGLLRHTQRYLDMPLFARMYHAWAVNDRASVVRWNAHLLAARESHELRAEELNVGAALARLLADIGIERARLHNPCSDAGGEEEALLQPGYLAMFTLACVEWRIPLFDAACGYLWSWCQNQVAAAIKLVPLGQTAGQKILQDLIALIPSVANQALSVEDDIIGFTAPGLALASARHEGQYTRLFLS